MRNFDNMKMNDCKRQRFVGLIAFLFPVFLFAQSQYDYMDDSAVAGGVDRALNGIIIIVLLVIAAIVLLFLLNGIFNLYYWFNPKAEPSYKRAVAKQEYERKHEEYVQEQRKNAHPNAVDIGLSVKWASFNVGAYKPSDIGPLFRWAENRPSIVGCSQHKKIKEDVIVGSNGNVGGDERYDAATKMYGSNWRLPTDKECQELIDNCKWEPKVVDGIEGRLVIGKNGNSLFLPFNQINSDTDKYESARYWTSIPLLEEEGAKVLRFGGNSKSPAEISSTTLIHCMYSIRPVFTSVTKDDTDKQMKSETQKAYARILDNNYSLSDNDIDYKFYQEQCVIRENEKDLKGISHFYYLNLIDGKYLRDEHNVIYSLDGKRLLEGSHCNCKVYRIKEGTEFVCDNAFDMNFFDCIRGKKNNCEKIILPSTLLYFSPSAVREGCTMESLSSNYNIINDLLIDTRTKCVVKCLNRFVQKVEIYEPIEIIGERAFFDCEVLQEVVLPNSIRIIGDSAFSHCIMLRAINLPDSIRIIGDSAFSLCKALRICRLPQNIYVIGDFAFHSCVIENVVLPNSIKSIGVEPFSKDTTIMTSESSRYVVANSLLIDSFNKELIQLVDPSVKKVTIPDDIIKIRHCAFSDRDIESIIIPLSVKELGSGLFSGCKYLEDVQLYCDIERLPNSTFSSCSSLTSFKVPKSIKSIGFYAFSWCKNLQTVELNQGLRIIGNQAFEGCVKLVSLNIPESIEKIGSGSGCCFSECGNLKELCYDARDAEITGLPSSISMLTIGSNVVKLPQKFLTKNSELISLTIPDNVQRIEKDCIVDCSNLREISILSKHIVIEKGWIRDCKGLRTIRIHANTYEELLPQIPKEKNIKIKKIYDHQFLFFKW